MTREYGDNVQVGARKRRAIILSADRCGDRDGYSVQFENGERAWMPAVLVVDATPPLFEKVTPDA